MKKRLQQLLIIFGIIVLIWLIYLCGGVVSFVWFVWTYFTWLIPIVPLTYAIHSLCKKQFKKVVASIIVFIILSLLFIYYISLTISTGAFYRGNTLIIRKWEYAEEILYEVDKPDVISVSNGPIIPLGLTSRRIEWRIKGVNEGDCTFTVRIPEFGKIKCYNIYHIHVNANKRIKYEFESIDVENNNTE